MEKPYIFLSPDGTQDIGLVVIVAADTGIIYASQCDGVNTDERAIEGFAVPVGHPSQNDFAKKLVEFFKKYPCPAEKPATEEIPELESIIAEIPFWKTAEPLPPILDEKGLPIATNMSNEKKAFLELDLDR